MTALPGPFNYLELRDREALSFVPKSWEFGEFIFTTTGGRTKTVIGTRIHLSSYKGIPMYRGLPYIDIGQQKLMYFLRPQLETATADSFEFTVVAFGVRPRTEYQVSVRQV